MPSKVVLPQPLQRASYFFFIVGEALFPLFMQMKIESFKVLTQIILGIRFLKAVLLP